MKLWFRRMGYDVADAPAILVPGVGHTIAAERAGVVSRSMRGFTNARQVIARDIRELRRVYPDVPNSKLQQLIRMEDLGQTTTAATKAAEKARIQRIVDATGTVPVGNQRSFGP